MMGHYLRIQRRPATVGAAAGRGVFGCGLHPRGRVSVHIDLLKDV